MNLELKKFDMKKIRFNSQENTGPVIVLIGRRDTGKSFLVRDLLYYHQDIPVGTVISGTEAGNGFYADHVPKLFIHDEYKPVIISNLLKRQRTLVTKMNEDIRCQGRTCINPKAFLILDDCLYDNSWTKNADMRSIFMNGRHYKILFMLNLIEIDEN